jgi:predicted membrane chloride channel (bestrophin family)
MDLAQGSWIVIGLIIGLVAGMAASTAASRWWYGRKLTAAAHRLHKSDKGRLFAQEQTLQARRQIEALKKELAVLQLVSADAHSSRQRVRELEEAIAVADPEPPADSGLMPLAPSHGFADTQVLS